MSTAPVHPHRSLVPRRLIIGALVLLIAAVLTGFAFAGWTANGAALYHALSANGLAWCL
ncbi:hypothetical protein OEG84_08965 [Hoeflea sp. G2-23]|uniref:Uncharacterized protein n=1 Tax=Hoeflea algicola TaxID=2983763 RepID=A0ABT3Z7Y9_9HYPH|nr:hypothetical protein [Hoeflea algicola]MCY0147839.1 hypothetical protein [Hoeflea algicola]